MLNFLKMEIRYKIFIIIVWLLSICIGSSIKEATKVTELDSEDFEQDSLYLDDDSELDFSTASLTDSTQVKKQVSLSSSSPLYNHNHDHSEEIQLQHQDLPSSKVSSSSSPFFDNTLDNTLDYDETTSVQKNLKDLEEFEPTSISIARKKSNKPPDENVQKTLSDQPTSESFIGKRITPKPKDRGVQEEKLLMEYLMQGYEKDVRPVRNASDPVVIRVGITLTQIFDMDEKNQVLTTNVWLDQEWVDEMLTWDPAEFGGCEMIRLPCEKIWLPDIVLYNNADDYTKGYMRSRAMVQYNGNVFWPPPTQFKSTCHIDVSMFPFDLQICTLKLGSWAYNGNQVDIRNRTESVDLTNYIPNGEWDLLNAELERTVVIYPCCEDEPFPDIRVRLVIQRKTLYYIYNIVLPCMMLSALTLLVFCLPPDSGEKIALGITVLLAFSVFMLAIAEKMPETSESIPLIGIYLTAVMAITSISVIVTVIVLNLHYLGPRVKPVPAWLRYFLPPEDVSFLRQKSLLIPASSRHPVSGSLKRPQVMIASSRTGAYITSTVAGDHLDVMSECSSNESVNNQNESRQRHTCSNSADSDNNRKAENAGNVCNHHHRQNQNQSLNQLQRSIDEQNRRNEGKCTCGSDNATTAATSTKLQEDLLKSIQYLISKQEDIEAQNILVAEWRLVAQVVDRVLFWIFFIVTVASSAIFLVILPVYKRSSYNPTTPMLK